MTTLDLLKSRKDTLCKRWFEAIVDAYPGETSRFLKKNKDQFANPMGNTLSKGTAEIVEALLAGAELSAMQKPVADIVRVRAIQNFEPATVVSFVLVLKKVVRDLLEPEWSERATVEGFLEFSAKIDQVCLLACNELVACREKISELKVNEVKRRVSNVLKHSPLWDGDVECIPYQTEPDK